MTLLGLSSMATRLLLADMVEQVLSPAGIEIAFEAGGGVAVAGRVRAGEAADVLVLADDAMAALAEEGYVVAGSLRPLLVSQVVAAVPASPGAAGGPALATEEDLRALLLGASRIGYSTGPSGTALVALIRSWGLAESVEPKLAQAPAGVPVGTMLVSGDADLAFQQRSELLGMAGVTVLGPLPGGAAITSTFTGGVLASASDPGAAARVLDLLAGTGATALVVRHGMQQPR